MKIEYDPQKNRWNIAQRNLSFDRAKDLDWETVQIVDDARKDYSERRLVAVGYLEGRLHILCFTPINHGIRVISFRKANNREVRAYEQNATD